MEEVKGSESEKEKEGLVSPGAPMSNDNKVADQKPVSVKGRTTGPARRSSKGYWTPEKDEILALAVQKFKKKSWKKIAELLPGQTDVQCLHRWNKVLDPDLLKGPWTKEEDDLIIELVRKQGNEKKKWAQIAKELPRRMGKQCRERWVNHLDPGIKRTPWTKEEEMTLIEGHSRFGNRWAEIAKSLPGRTENSIKNLWNCSLKKKLHLYTARGTALSHHGLHTVDSNNHKPEVGSGKTELSLGQKLISERNLATCSPNLVRQIPREEFQNNSLNPRFGSSNPSLGSHVNPMYINTHTNKSRDLSNLSPSQPHGHFSFSPNSPLGAITRSGNDLPPHKISLSANSNGFLKFPKGKHSILSSVNHLRYGGNGKRNDPKRTLNLSGEKNIGTLCYVPLQEEDLNIFVATGEFPNTDSYIRLPSSPDSIQTPTTDKRDLSNDHSSPESILKSAAMSFENVPSIIRKQGLRSSRQASNNGSQDECISAPNAKQIFLSPPKSRMVENSAATNSVEKCLESAFDEVSEL